MLLSRARASGKSAGDWAGAVRAVTDVFILSLASSANHPAVTEERTSYWFHLCPHTLNTLKLPNREDESYIRHALKKALFDLRDKSF